jgi:hypothetical protein
VAKPTNKSNSASRKSGTTSMGFEQKQFVIARPTVTNTNDLTAHLSKNKKF